MQITPHSPNSDCSQNIFLQIPVSAVIYCKTWLGCLVDFIRSCCESSFMGSHKMISHLQCSVFATLPTFQVHDRLVAALSAGFSIPAALQGHLSGAEAPPWSFSTQSPNERNKTRHRLFRGKNTVCLFNSTDSIPSDPPPLNLLGHCSFRFFLRMSERLDR